MNLVMDDVVEEFEGRSSVQPGEGRGPHSHVWRRMFGKSGQGIVERMIADQ